MPNAITHTAPSRPTTLITGASSGIGLELAHIFARNHHNLILAARTLPALEALSTELSIKYNITATPIQTDLSTPTAPTHLYNEIQSRGLQVNILVNNAGFGTGGRFDQISIEQHLDLIQVNITALTALTRLFLPDMLAKKTGRILNVASTAAFQPGPFLATYYASKAYVLSLSQAIAEEIRNTGVTVTALCPGPTKTQFATTANLNRTRLFNSPFSMSAQDVAQYGYDALMSGKRVAIPGLANRLVAFGTRLAPRRLSTSIARRLQEFP